MELNNNNDNNEMKNCKKLMVLYNFNTFPIVINTRIFNHTYFPPQLSVGVVRIEIGNKLKVKIGFSNVCK